MAGPVFYTNGARATSAGAATLTPAKPTVYGQNGKLYATLQTKNNAVHSTATGGWAKVNQTNSGAGFTASLWEASEGSAAPVFTWTGSVACSAQVFYCAAPDNTLDTNGGFTASSGATSTHTSTALNTTRANSLVAYFDCAAANTALATPSGWTEEIDAGSATDAGRTAFGDKAVAVSGTSSGAISVTGAAAAWVQWQIEIRGSAATAGLQASEIEAGAWEEPPAGLAASEIEAGAWEEPPAGLAASEIEVGVWLDLLPFIPPVRHAPARPRPPAHRRRSPQSLNLLLYGGATPTARRGHMLLAAF